MAGLSGSALAVLPALAVSNPSVQASDFKFSPTPIAITPGQSVDFSNAGGTHDVDFTSAVPASCSGSTGQIGPSAASATKPTVSSATWSGSCTFSQAGTYSFICDLHHFSGTIYVNAAGTVPATTTTTTTTNPPPTTPGTTPTNTTPTTTAPGSTTTGSTTPGSTTPGSTTPGSTTPGSTTPGSTAPGYTTSGAPSGGGRRTAASALQLLAVQRGATVIATVVIATDGSSFEADLVGDGAQLARTATFGKTVKRGVRAGKLRFKVALSRRARAALHRRHRLSLTLVVKVGGANGTSSLSKHLTVRG